MLNFLRVSSILLLIILAGKATPQKLDIKFGEIPLQDLEMTLYKLDPGADAAVLSDCGNAELVDASEGFQIVFIRDTRIKIINKNGFDYANIEIPFFITDNIANIQASTFNLQNGKIIETKVSKKSFIFDNDNKYKRVLRIAFPNVHEGSVIELRYRLTTKSIFGFIPWRFQANIPIRHTEFTASYPTFFSYKSLIVGDGMSIAKASTTENVVFGGYSTTGNTHKWMGENIPAFREEPLITGSEDYITRLEFELAGVNFPGSNYEEITPTYATLAKKLLDRDDFGLALKKNSFLSKPTRKLIAGAKTDLAKLKIIQHFIAEKIQWDGNDDYTVSKSLKRVYYEERGNSGEINLLLIAMLRQAGLTVDPVLLSTRSNGLLHPTLAMVQRFNYVIAQVLIGGKSYLVDATDPLLPYNNLPFECLNNQGRLIHTSISEWVTLANKEKYLTSSLINLKIDNSGVIDGDISNSYSSYNAYSKRKFIKLESLDGYKDYVKTKYANWEISDFQVANIDSVEIPINESYNIKIKDGAQITPNNMIFNPYILIRNNENPFSSEKRNFSIDYGCPTFNTFTLKLTIPDGFEVDEKPSNVSIKLPDGGGEYIYNCLQNGNVITIQSKFSINNIRFEPHDYIILREFYAQVMRKQSELIVLKKKV
jgi:hypothetical protein